MASAAGAEGGAAWPQTTGAVRARNARVKRIAGAIRRLCAVDIKFPPFGMSLKWSDSVAYLRRDCFQMAVLRCALFNKPISP